MNLRSPFTGNRFEYEQKHLYYLQEDIFGLLEDPKPIYLIGSRGTGKTTFLKALSWEERINNVSLRSQLKDNLFGNRYIGVYLKLPKTQLHLFDTWLIEEASIEIYDEFISLYLDLIFLELLISAVSELIVLKIIEVPLKNEYLFVDRILKDYPSFQKFLLPQSQYSLMNLFMSVKGMRKTLEECAKFRSDVNPLIKSFPVDQIGSLSRSVTASLAKLCDGDPNSDSDVGWHFKICLDEGESLTTPQLRVVNTMVRLAEWPTFPIFSFVNFPEDITSTTIPNLSLQKADRHLIVLDTMRDTNFKEFGQGVATVRIQHQMKRDDVQFNIDKLLGNLDLNRQLQTILQRSVNPKAKMWLEKAEKLQTNSNFEKYFFNEKTNSNDVKSPPIYQTYLIEKLKLEIPKPEDPRWERRRQESREIRKKMVAAYLSLCYELKTDVLYASSDMVLQMSDNCIRDLLSQIEEIFRESKKDLEEFIKKRVNDSIQHQALVKASKKKMESLPNYGVSNPDEMSHLISGLAKITTFIQIRGENNSHLLSSERGRFEIETVPNKELYRRICETVKDASEAGFLRQIESDDSKLIFRVHTSLAAAFGFSYRGAYYSSKLSISDIDNLRNSRTTEQLDEAVDIIGRRLIGNVSTLPLFQDLDK